VGVVSWLQVCKGPAFGTAPGPALALMRPCSLCTSFNNIKMNALLDLAADGLFLFLCVLCCVCLVFRHLMSLLSSESVCYDYRHRHCDRSSFNVSF